MKWQPITTAPQGETRVLVFRAGWAESMTVAYFSQDWDEWLSVSGSFVLGITHWMPLPDPPVDVETK